MNVSGRHAGCQNKTIKVALGTEMIREWQNYVVRICGNGLRYVFHYWLEKIARPISIGWSRSGDARLAILNRRRRGLSDVVALFRTTTLY